MDGKYWVVGGEYTGTDFARLITGTERLIGPFAERQSALHAWRKVALETRGNCCVRFTLVRDVAGGAEAAASPAQAVNA